MTYVKNIKELDPYKRLEEYLYNIAKNFGGKILYKEYLFDAETVFAIIKGLIEAIMEEYKEEKCKLLKNLNIYNPYCRDEEVYMIIHLDTPYSEKIFIENALPLIIQTLVKGEYKNLSKKGYKESEIEQILLDKYIPAEYLTNELRNIVERIIKNKKEKISQTLTIPL